MSGIFRLMRLASVCAILPMTASIAAIACYLSISGDRDGDGVVTDAKMALANQDYKNDNIRSVCPGEIEHVFPKL